MFTGDSVGARAAAAIMFIIGVMFGIAAAVNMIILAKVILIFSCLDNIAIYQHYCK